MCLDVWFDPNYTNSFSIRKILIFNESIDRVIQIFREINPINDVWIERISNGSLG